MQSRGSASSIMESPGRRVVYFLSSPRGGSTLLGELLGRHSKGANLGEVAQIPKHLALGELCTCGIPECECPAWARVFDELDQRTGVDLRRQPYGLYLGDAIKQRLAGGRVDREHQTRFREIQAKLRGAVDTAQLLSLPNRGFTRSLTLPSVRRSVDNTFELYTAAAQAWHASLLIDASKAPKKGVHLYLGRPDVVRLIHLVRDGRSVCASRLEQMPIRHAAERWSHYHRLADRLLERWVNPEHWRRLRYEDLARDPEASLGTLLDWLGFEFEAEMLDFSVQYESHSAGGNPARFVVGEGITPPQEKWRTAFGTSDLQEFDVYAGPLNRRFGYG